MANLQSNMPLVNVPFVGTDGRISEVWFLFLVQLFRRTGGTVPITPITVGDILSLEETFALESGNQIDKVFQDIFPSFLQADKLFQDVTSTALTANKLSEMISVPQSSTSFSQGAVSITLGASPATYTATYPQGVSVSGGTVTAITVQRGSSVLPIGTSGSDIVDSQPSFTPGVSTSVTLPNSFGAVSRLWVFFDGVFQGDDQISSLVGTTLTFTSAIPTGTTKVYVKGLLQSSIGVGSTLVELSTGDKLNVTYSSLPNVTVLPR